MKNLLNIYMLCMITMPLSFLQGCKNTPVEEEQYCSTFGPVSCDQDDKCEWVSDACVPADPSVSGTCGAIKQSFYCNQHKSSKGETCIYNLKTNKCEAQAKQEIYVWKKLRLPSYYESTVDKLVVSKDKKNFYAYGGLIGDRGLFHSPDGENWTNLATIRAKVSSAAVNNGTYNTADSAPIELIPTTKGAVVASTEGVFILEAKEAKWGIERRVNSPFATNIVDQVPDFAPFENIAFADVVLLNDIEAVVFGQSESLGTRSKVWTHKIDGDFDKAPDKLVIKYKNGTALDNHWIRAGNTFDGDLLLAAAATINIATKKNTGLWLIPKVNTNAQSLRAGQVAFYDPVLYPGPDQNWNNGATNRDDRNLNISVVGSFNNHGVSEYFAGMAHDGWKSVKGLAHFKGVQGPNDKAALDFVNDHIYGINIFNNIIRLRSLMLLGVNANGAPNKEQNYHLPTSSSDIKEMTPDRRRLSEYNVPTDIFGDDDLAFIFSKTSYLYSRTKVQGLPRSEF